MVGEIGVGSPMTPMSVLGFGQPATIVVGTDLVLAALTTLSGIASYGYKKHVDWRIASSRSTLRRRIRSASASGSIFMSSSACEASSGYAG
jgi:uncharacterized membrane protein YfcA